MKPLTSDVQDAAVLQELGRASVQIVHDLKNQINGLKLYATFLRKRMEKSERPADEQETVSKLIAGLERASVDMTTLVRYGRPLELRRQAGTDLLKVLTVAAAGESGNDEVFAVEAAEGSFAGDYDVAALTEALRTITANARNSRGAGESGPLHIKVRREETEDGSAAVIEWPGANRGEGVDPFHSFAGSEALRMLLAAKTIAAHGGRAEQVPGALRVQVPLTA